MNRTITAQALRSHAGAATLLDVRRKADREADGSQLPGSTWHDPEQVAQWAPTLAADKEWIVYCMRGGSVSNTVLDALRARGLKARYIEGGIVAWKEAGGAVVAL